MVISRISSVVEQWPEEPRVVSSILTFGTIKQIVKNKNITYPIN